MTQRQAAARNVRAANANLGQARRILTDAKITDYDATLEEGQKSLAEMAAEIDPPVATKPPAKKPAKPGAPHPSQLII